jgi:hypothetical protein
MRRAGAKMNRFDSGPIRGVRRLLLSIMLIASPSTVLATVYDVGPAQKYAKIGNVPWYALKAGDIVYIHCGTYKEKFLISGQGTPDSWIRIIGVPCTDGSLPVISGDGATTSTNMHWHWTDPTTLQLYGIVHVAISDQNVLPAYIEISNLEIRDSGSAYSFSAENGSTLAYSDFSACIYARSVQHLILSNNIFHNCGLGVFNWTGAGSNWWDGLAKDHVIRGNYFYDNGAVGNFSMHQIYTESDGVTIEYNRFGPPKVGMKGSQIKDRSAGTVIRYNYIEQSPAGWDLDLVDPQNAWDALGVKNTFTQTFVYGNILVNNDVSRFPDYVHWNQDSTLTGHGRAEISGSKLLFYNNTLMNIGNLEDYGSGVWWPFNFTWGGFDCSSTSPVGIVDVRDNIFASLPRTPGHQPAGVQFGFCDGNFAFGANWVSIGWTTKSSGSVTGVANIVAPSVNDPGFVSVPSDLHLSLASTARSIGTALAAEVKSNFLTLDLTPTVQYVYHQKITNRPSSGPGSDAGAFAFIGTQISAPTNLRIVK